MLTKNENKNLFAVLFWMVFIVAMMYVFHYTYMPT